MVTYGKYSDVKVAFNLFAHCKTYLNSTYSYSRCISQFKANKIFFRVTKLLKDPKSAFGLFLKK